MQQELLQWTGGSFVHNHFRIEDLVSQLSPEDHNSFTSYMSWYKEGSFSLDVASLFTKRMFGKTLPTTDTQHPAYVLDENFENLPEQDRSKYLNPRARDKSVQLMTDCMLERRRIIRKHDHLAHVLTGVEVDILSPKGEMDVEDEGLAKLDYVTASFHTTIWRPAGNPSPTIITSIDTYQAVVNNPHVDTLSHPTYYLPEEVKDQMTVGDWTNLFSSMKQKQVAFEINMDSSNLTYGANNELDRKLIASAAEEGVPLVIGFDFHNLEDWGCFPSPDLLIDTDEATQLFGQLAKNGSNSKFLARIMGNIYALKQMGIRPEDIVNANPNSFNSWLSQRAS